VQWFDIKMSEEQDYDYEYEYNDKGEIVYYAIRPNKTRIKKDMAVLFALSEELSVLPSTQLKALDLPDNIYKALAEASGMPYKSARKRLLKFITGQLNKIDLEPYLEKLACMKSQSAHAVREHHIAERWRARLINDGNIALTELLNDHPHADSQQLRQLIRNVKKETELAKPPKSSRLLYRYLKVLLNIDDDTEFDDVLEDETIDTSESETHQSFDDYEFDDDEEEDEDDDDDDEY
jgi:ribosome-associated protein